MSEIGLIVEREWLRLERPGVIVDEYIVMPNHVHGVIAVEKSSGTSLPKLMRGFKSCSVKVLQQCFKDPECRIWQRSYREDIIYGAVHLARIREYIKTNPANWDNDEYRWDHPGG